MKHFLIAVAVLFATSGSVSAADMTIDMLNKRDDGAKMVYSVDVAKEIKIQQGGVHHF